MKQIMFKMLRRPNSLSVNTFTNQRGGWVHSRIFGFRVNMQLLWTNTGCRLLCACSVLLRAPIHIQITKFISTLNFTIMSTIHSSKITPLKHQVTREKNPKQNTSKLKPLFSSVLYSKQERPQFNVKLRGVACQMFSQRKKSNKM